MVSDQATTEPAPEPRPGPTGMSFSFAHLRRRNATIASRPVKISSRFRQMESSV